MYPHQAERLTDALRAAKLDALVATSPANVRYVSAFRSLTQIRRGSSPLAVFSDHGTALAVPAIDVPTVLSEGVAVDHLVCFGELPRPSADSLGAAVRQIEDVVVTSRAATPGDALALALGRLGLSRGSIGVDERGLDHEAWRALTDCLNSVEVMAASARFAEARRVKAPYEIECLARALHVAEEALDVVIQTMDRGMTERDAAALYAAEVVKRGGCPLPSVVAMGEHTAIPAPWPTDRALRRGDLVRLEMRCRHKGYHAGVGRTAVLGEPTPSQETAHAAIRAGLEAAIELLSPGVRPERVAEAASAAVRANGLPRYEGRLIGYGMGLEPRESPEFERDPGADIEMGEVLAVEMPYWELGAMGVSVQDTALVTSAGVRAMNRSHRALVVLD